LDFFPREGFDVAIDEEVVGGAVVAFDGDLFGEGGGGDASAAIDGEVEVVGVEIGG
jgi:hypothetical protein